MSRVGKLPIPLPEKVSVECANNTVNVTGPKGSLSCSLSERMQIDVTDSEIVVTRPTETSMDRSLHGLTRSLIANMVTGVSQGFTKVLEIRGVGYRAEVQGNKLVLQLGFSHPIELVAPEGIGIEVEALSPTADRGYLAAVLTMTCIDKQLLGDFAANVRKLRPVEPYKGKGVRYRGERVIRKLGKAAKAGGSGGGF